MHMLKGQPICVEMLLLPMLANRLRIRCLLGHAGMWERSMDEMLGKLLFQE